MKNKRIMITGANGGLGKAFIKAILELSPDIVYCTARDIKSMDSIKDISERVEVIEMDITSKNSIYNAVSKIDTLDILINNAGSNSNTRLFDSSFSDLEVNLKGTINLTEALFKKLKVSKGKVVNITSIMALINFPSIANYCISKSALHSFTQALRSEFKLFDGEVYEVLPGPIDTRMSEELDTEKTKAKDVVDIVLNAIKNKEFEIYPDKASKSIKKRLEQEPIKIVEEFLLSLPQDS